MKSVEQIFTELWPEVDFASSRDFIADRLLDSFDVITLVAELESVYAVKIDGTSILPRNFASMDAVRGLLREHGIQA